MTNRPFKLRVSIVLAGLLTLPGLAAELVTLPGHVPPAVVKDHLLPAGSLPPDSQMNLVVNLRPRNLAMRDGLLRQIYNPASTNFHRYLAPAQYREKFGPTEADYQAVLDFVRTNGFTVRAVRRSRSLVEVQASAREVERTFHVKLRVYPHPTEPRTFFAPDTEPAVDRSIPIQAISGLNNYVLPHPLGSGRPVASGDGAPGQSGGGGSGGGLFLGSDYRHAYLPGTALTGQGEVAGLFEYNGYNLSDIQNYESAAGYTNVPLVNVLLNGLTSNQAPAPNDVEISGDIENLIAIAPGLQAVNVYEGNFSVDASGNTILDEMADPMQGETLPHELSCSWGFNADSASSNNFVRLAMQGQSFFLASGDGGAYPTQTGDATDNEDAEPDITVVGGTELTMTNNGAGWSNETVWNNPSEGSQFASSGGYLVNVPIPDYQARINLSANQGSSQNRNLPDVAMAADNIEIVLTVVDTNNVAHPGTVFTSWGTSFASPLWAGVAALANQQALQMGKPRVGFINPALYGIAESASYAGSFHDITVGNNTWSNSPTVYYAKSGYDLCTGWGSPANPNLVALLAGYGGPVFVDYNFTGAIQDGDYDAPFSKLAQGVSAVSPNGTVFIKTSGTSPETFTISKPLTIVSPNGPATTGE
jgi:subtilase family serine protease